MQNDEIRTRWRGAGGDFHGPNVEHGSMPEAKLLPYLGGLYDEIERLRTTLRHAREWCYEVGDYPEPGDIVKEIDAALEQGTKEPSR